MTRAGGEPDTLVNHVGIIVEGADTLADCWVVEAVGKGVTCHRIRDRYRARRGRVAVWRLDLPQSVLAKVVRSALRACGQKYSWWKIMLHALDWSLSGFGLWKVPYVFCRLARTSSRPICSYLVARHFWLHAEVDFGVALKSADPDDIFDWCVDNAKLVRPLMAIRADPWADIGGVRVLPPKRWRVRTDADFTLPEAKGG